MSAFEELWERKDLRILIIGGDGRASAFEWACWRSPRVSNVIVAPGNGGSRDRRKISVDNHEMLLELIVRERVDLVVISPEGPLADGLADRIAAAGVAVVGPGAFGARLEANKYLANEFCLRHGIKKARWKAVRSFAEAHAAILAWGSVPVVKARGLCGGKGVFVEDTIEAAIEAARWIFVDRIFHEQGDIVILEDRLYGDEFSLIAACNRLDYVRFPVFRDYKRAYAGDIGPNTGSMGGYSPVPDYDDAFLAQVGREFIEPVLQGMVDANHPYRGFLYAGLMKTVNGIYLIEYNCRFGDPEAEGILPRLETDFVEILLCMIEGGDLRRVSPLRVSPRASVCITLADGNYPGKPRIGLPVEQLGTLPRGVEVFHAGTERDDEGKLVTAGGRVMYVTGVADTLSEARLAALTAAEAFWWDGRRYRDDIAKGIK